VLRVSEQKARIRNQANITQHRKIQAIHLPILLLILDSLIRCKYIHPRPVDMSDHDHPIHCQLRSQSTPIVQLVIFNLQRTRLDLESSSRIVDLSSWVFSQFQIIHNQPKSKTNQSTTRPKPKPTTTQTTLTKHQTFSTKNENNKQTNKP